MIRPLGQIINRNTKEVNLERPQDILLLILTKDYGEIKVTRKVNMNEQIFEIKFQEFNHYENTHSKPKINSDLDSVELDACSADSVPLSSEKEF